MLTDILFIQKIFGIKISNAPNQHLDIVRARAIETASPILRSSNLGISAVIDSRGKVLKKANPYKEEILEGVIGVYDQGETLFQQILN